MENKLQNNTRLGILLMIMTTFVFALQDVISRYLATNYNVFSVVMIRYWFFAMFVIIFAISKKSSKGGFHKIVATKHLYLQILRGILLVSEVCVMIFAFTKLGLVESHAIFTFYPLLVVALSGPILKEKIGLKRWLIICFGFIGVMIILQPSAKVFNFNVIIPIFSALLFALYGILTRYVSRNDPAETSFFWTGVSGAVAISLVGPVFWMPLSKVDWFWMILLCVAGILGHYLLIKTFEAAEASAVQPFSYFQFIFASAFGVLIFKEIISLKIIIGSLVIILAGLYALWTEQKFSKQKS